MEKETSTPLESRGAGSALRSQYCFSPAAAGGGGGCAVLSAAGGFARALLLLLLLGGAAAGGFGNAFVARPPPGLAVLPLAFDLFGLAADVDFRSGSSEAAVVAPDRREDRRSGRGSRSSTWAAFLLDMTADNL